MRVHGRRALGLLRRLLGDPGAAEDAWQETWVSVWKALPRVRAAGDPWPYIRRTAVRKALDLRRSDAARPRLVTGSDPEPVSDTARAPGIDLGALPPEHRAALVLFFWEGLSVKEIGEVLGVPAGTVKTWMFRGRARLRETMLQRKEAP